jgi:isoquinoline 1-oxidoreductase alpha subunit
MGTKFGCGVALCGACTVLVDKDATRACITSISDVDGREITTIEGLHPTGDHPVQRAWRQINVPQCGYCQAGQIMQAAALLMDNPKPSHDQIREAMSGNICRCGCYQRIENAVHLASTGV